MWKWQSLTKKDKGEGEEKKVKNEDGSKDKDAQPEMLGNNIINHMPIAYSELSC